MMTIFEPFANTLENMRDSWAQTEKTLMPRADLRDTDDSYILDADLPGFQKDEIQLQITGDVMTISAEHKEGNEEKTDEKGTYLQKQRRFCKYQQQVDISNVDTENINAVYENGVLTITMPKKQKTVPTALQIPIQ